MYKVPDIYLNYYEDYIDRDIREFKLECKINALTIAESDISSINIEHDLLLGSEDYTIGNLATAKLTMKVSSNVNAYEYQEINLTVKLKARDVYGTEIWIPVPLGRFYISDITQTNLSKKIIAYDDLSRNELGKSFVSRNIYPISSHVVISEICSSLGIGYSAIDLPDELINRPVYVSEKVLNENGKYEVIESDSNQVCFGMTKGEALSYIAAYLGGNFIIDGDRKLKFIKLSMKEADIAKTYPYTAYAPPTFGEAYYNITKIDCVSSNGDVLSVGYSDNGIGLEIKNPFYDKTKLLDLLEYMKTIKYSPALVKVKGDPRIQLGDLIKLQPFGSSNFTTSIPVLRMKFSFTGGCSIEIESVCRTETEKSSNYKGTISSRLDGLETTVSKSETEIEGLYESLYVLETIKDYIDDMDVLVATLSNNVSSSKLNQYNLIMDQIERSDLQFETKYNLVYNHRYL